MRNRYIDAELRLGQLLGWTNIDQTLQKLKITAYAFGTPPGGSGKTTVPAWARSNADCTTLMLERDCYVTLEKTAAGEDVMEARWKACAEFPASVKVLVAEHSDKACAYRYAAVLAVTLILENDSEGPRGFERSDEPLLRHVSALSV